MITPHILDQNVPQVLRDTPQWVLWKFVVRKPGEKPTKVPVSAEHRLNASSTDPSTWCGYEQAKTTAQGIKAYEGIGFVFSANDPFCGIDLDGCVVDGKLTEQAKEIIAAFNSYTEVSPSGTGVKIFIKGKKPEGVGCKTGKIEGMAHIEVYDSGRFFTVTGQRLESTPKEAEDRQEQLDKMCAWLWPPKAGARILDLPAAAEEVPQVANLSTCDEGGDKDYHPGQLANSSNCPPVDMASRERRCRAYLEKCPDAISGQGGHDATLRAACECFRFGLDEATAWRVMQWFNSAKTGGEPWSDKEVAHKLDSARKKVEQAGEVGVRLVDLSPPAAEMSAASIAALQTDVGNAARLVQRFGNKVRYCFGPEQWLIWDGRRWRIDDRGVIVKLCKQTALSILDEAKGVSGDAQKELIDWAMASQKRERLTAMAVLAQPEVGVGPDDLDADPWAFNVLNGTIDLRTGELRPHRQVDLLTKIAPVEFDPAATCPRFDSFLQRTFDNDADLIRFVQRWHGHCLSADIREQYLPIYHGEGNNGKSVLLDTIAAVMGDYAGEAPPDLVTVRKHPEHPTEIADLLGKRLVIASETERDAELRLQLIKRLTGNARLKARRMRQDYFEFARTHKMILVTNNRPAVKEETEAVWRRLRLVPFSVIIPKAERDPDLMRKLRNEYSGILAWMVRGCVDWLGEGLTEPEAVVLATEAYRGAANISTVESFLGDCCTLAEGLYCLTSDLLGAYNEWCAARKKLPLRQKAFAAAMRAKGCIPQKMFGQWHWLNVSLDVTPPGQESRIGHECPVDPAIPAREGINGQVMSIPPEVSGDADPDADEAGSSHDGIGDYSESEA